MWRLIIISFLIFGVPISPNAAGILDNSLMNGGDKKKEKLDNIKVDAMHLLTDEASSEYEIELISILKKNTIKYKLQDESLVNQRSNLANASSNNSFTVVSNDDSDSLELLESSMAWEEIKSDLKYTNNIFNAINSWGEKYIDEYLGENRNANFVFITNIQTIRHSSDSQSNVTYRRDTHVRSEDYSYKTPSSYNDEINNNYGHDGGNILSIVYLWKIYSGTIIVVISVITTLWLVIATLVRLLTRYV